MAELRVWNMCLDLALAVQFYPHYRHFYASGKDSRITNYVKICFTKIQWGIYYRIPWCVLNRVLFLLSASSNKSTLMSKSWKVRKQMFQVWGGDMASLFMMIRHQDSEVLSCWGLITGQTRKLNRFFFHRKEQNKN